MGALPIVGELTIHTAAEQKDLLLDLLNSPDELEIVLSGVTELDTAGLQLLLLIKREAARVSRQLRFTAPSQVVLDVLKIAYLDTDLNGDADGGPDFRSRDEISR